MLADGDVGPLADAAAIDVEPHPLRGQRRGGQVPRTVVVGLGAAQDLAVLVGLDAEQDVAGVVQVELAVHLAGVAVDAVAAPDELAAGGPGRAEPCLDGEHVGRAVLHAGVGPRGRGSGEPGSRGQRVGQERSRRAQGHAGAGDAQRLEARGIGDGRARRLVEAPPVRGLTGVDRRDVPAVDTGGGHGHVDPRGVRDVAERIGHGHAVAVRRAGIEPGVGVAHAERVPPARPHAACLQQTGTALGVAVQPVGEVVVVDVLVRGPAEPDRALLGRAGLQRVRRAVEARSLAVGGQTGPGEAHQTLLRPAVDPGELPAHRDVVGVAGDAPRPLDLAGVRAGVDAGVPGQHRRARLALEVVVAALVGLPGHGARDVAAEGGRPVVRVVADASCALADAVDVLAVVRVARGVDHLVLDVQRVGVAVAVVGPVHRAVGPGGRERALPGPTGTAVGVAAAVDVVAVGGEGRDRSVGGPVPDDRVDLERQARAGRGVHHAEPVARVGGAVQRGEGAADHELGAVRVDRERPDVTAGRRRCPREERSVRRVEGCEALADLGADVLELSTGVDGRVRRGQCVDVVVHRRVERGDQRTGGGVERRDASVGDAVDRREVAADVDPRAVG